MSIVFIPEWMIGLEDEDLSFIKNFVIASGSIKAVATHYGVTYPTVRLRLDRLIQKMQISEDMVNEPFITLVKRLTINEKIDLGTAKILISEYKKTKSEVK